MTPRSSTAIAAAAMLLALGLTACSGDPVAAPTPTPSATPVPTDTTSPTPTPTPTPELEATCENTATAEFLAMMSSNGWVGWELPYNGIGGDGMFSAFPDGEPDGAIDCRWGADPDLATDNVYDLSWAPIDADAAAAAQAQLEAEGYERIEAPEGVYLAFAEGSEWVDENGYAQTYLFTETDVRWAIFMDELRFVKAPGDQG